MTEEDIRNDEINPNDEEARKVREEAQSYADRILAGEEPWKESAEWQEEQASLPEVRNDDVGENGEPEAEEDQAVTPPTFDSVEDDDGA